MNVITAFGIGAVIFVFSVLLTAFYLKSASVLASATNKDYTVETQKSVDDMIDDVVSNVNDKDMPETVSEES